MKYVGTRVSANLGQRRLDLTNKEIRALELQGRICLGSLRENGKEREATTQSLGF